MSRVPCAGRTIRLVFKGDGDRWRARYYGLTVFIIHNPYKLSRATLRHWITDPKQSIFVPPGSSKLALEQAMKEIRTNRTLGEHAHLIAHPAVVYKHCCENKATNIFAERIDVHTQDPSINS